MKAFSFNVEQYKDKLREVLAKINEASSLTPTKLHKILTKYPKNNGVLFSKDELVAGYRLLVAQKKLARIESLETKIKMKPTRTLSGVATVTVLTEPYRCPGRCIFCPNDPKMPKSYISNEPGAQRALMNKFDPFSQVTNRLTALNSIGHSVDKVELIVLGGTWSVYPDEYKYWFILQCLVALNCFGSKMTNKSNKIDRVNNLQELRKKLVDVQIENESSSCRCVGLSIETRPNCITPAELIRLRELGVTKVQLGVQSLDDNLLKVNKRGHHVSDVKDAAKLLRSFGFKIQVHWMPNLYGSTIPNDIADYRKLWKKEFRPDELKIYPTAIIENTELFNLYKSGKYLPYSEKGLAGLLKNLMKLTPEYCRISRVVRDFSSNDIVAGNKRTNLREEVEAELKHEGKPCRCIRCREVKGMQVKRQDLKLIVKKYDVAGGKEVFLSFVMPKQDKLAGFLRLFVPDKRISKLHELEELRNKAIIREVHVYGEVVGIGKGLEGKSQHIGLGSKLVEKAKGIAKKNGYKEIAVISAIGTRNYYRKLGFEIGKLYMTSHI